MSGDPDTQERFPIIQTFTTHSRTNKRFFSLFLPCYLHDLKKQTFFFLKEKGGEWLSGASHSNRQTSFHGTVLDELCMRLCCVTHMVGQVNSFYFGK